MIFRSFVPRRYFVVCTNTECACVRKTVVGLLEAKKFSALKKMSEIKRVSVE